MWLQVPYASFESTCQKAYCAAVAGKKDEARCNAIQNYATECSLQDVVISWRSRNLCRKYLSLEMLTSIWLVMPRLHESGPFQGSYGRQPRERTQHLLGPIWAPFRPANFKTHYVAPQFLIFWRTVQIAPNFIHCNAHIFLFWLNPTGHSKFHNTSNHSPPTTDSGRTARTPLYPPKQAAPLTPSLFFPLPDRGTGEGQYLCPWQACATTACSECAR